MFRFDPGFPAGGWHLVPAIQCLVHFWALGGITVRVGQEAVVLDAFFRKTIPFCWIPLIYHIAKISRKKQGV
jgi:hypothetical protein